MINNCTLIGRLTKDPNVKVTPSGVHVANFTLAVNRPFKNAEGQNEADFINVVAWRKTAELVGNYVKKGSLVGLVGRIQTRSYENDAGERVYVTEVVADSVQFLDTKKQGEGNSQQKPQTQTEADPFNVPDISGEDLPF